MSEELQSLLERINEEGVKKADAEAARIVSEARAQADKLLSDAKAQAEKTVAAAKADGEALAARSEAAVRQAARDIILELQSELKKRMDRAVANASAAALTPEFMAGLVKELAAKFAADPDAQISARTAVKDADALDKMLAASLAGSFKKQPRIFADSTIKGGLEVSFRDGAVYYDFTEEAITGLVGEYVGPRLAALLGGK
ncbi:MAG: V-type ATP synthase subunit E family protein [Victivallaceae bacterium]|nr:V-type ATP synthase subunit E family protein [Victivallaceae bacterium]